jgi:hypothetical protein
MSCIVYFTFPRVFPVGCLSQVTAEIKIREDNSDFWGAFGCYHEWLLRLKLSASCKITIRYSIPHIKIITRVIISLFYSMVKNNETQYSNALCFQKKGVSRFYVHLKKILHIVADSMSYSTALHSGYHHQVLRLWQQTSTAISAENLIYPLFIT